MYGKSSLVRGPAIWLSLALFLVALSPVLGAPSWEQLRAHYDYDATLPLNVKELQTTTLGECEKTSFTFAAVDGSTVPAVLFLPSGQPSQSLVLFLHGLGGSKDDARLMANMLCPQNVAVLAIDARDHGDRKQAGVKLISPDLNRFRQTVIGTIIDNRRALDSIASRTDFNPDKIVLVGVSMGGIFGSILAAVEPRIDAAALLVAGARWDILLRSSQHSDARQLRRNGLLPTTIRRQLAPVEPANFVGHIAPRPLFLVNGKLDRIITPRSAQALHNAARQPKQIHWYQAGHIGAVLQCMPDLADWLRRQLAHHEQLAGREVQQYAH